MGEKGEEGEEEAWEVPKAKSRRVKRRNVQASDGWTVVTHTGPGRSKDVEAILDGARPKDVVKGLTVEKLVGELRKLEERFRDTECARKMGEILKRAGIEGTMQEEAVCIGIGSFSLDWAHRWRALWQLVLFLFVVEQVTSGNGETSKPKLKLYAQEPLFTALDTSLLSFLGITVLSSGIEIHISNSTFVFAPFVDWNLLLPTFLRWKDPVLYIGNEILNDYSTYAQSPEKMEILQECNSIGRAFIKGREMMRVPELECHAHALNGLVVYTRLEVQT